MVGRFLVMDFKKNFVFLTLPSLPSQKIIAIATEKHARDLALQIKVFIVCLFLSSALKSKLLRYANLALLAGLQNFIVIDFSHSLIS